MNDYKEYHRVLLAQICGLQLVSHHDSHSRSTRVGAV